jgi:hypothetical protein
MQVCAEGGAPWWEGVPQPGMPLPDRKPLGTRRQPRRLDGKSTSGRT